MDKSQGSQPQTGFKVICNRIALVDALAPVAKVIAKRTPKPILTAVLLSADPSAPESLTLAGTDLETAIRVVIDGSSTQVQIERAGTVAVEAAKLLDVMRNITAAAVTMEWSGEGVDEMLTIVADGDKFKLHTMNPVEMPPIPAFTDPPTLKMAGTELKQLIDRTRFAAARESTHYAFNGCLMVASAKSVKMVATDGRRLAMASSAAPELFKNEEGKIDDPIIGMTCIGLLSDLLGDETVEVRQREKNSISFRVGNVTLTCNLIEGGFPPYQEVIPKESDKSFTASRSDLSGAIKRAALMTSEENVGVRFALDKSGIRFTSRSPTHGEAAISFPCKTDGALEIGFNPYYLLDGLRALDCDEVEMGFTAPNRPGLLTAPGFSYVVMPVNLQ